MNKKECEFLKHEIKFLGHIVGDTVASADPGKVEAITDMPRPTTVSQLRSFLSSISLLQQYTPNMASILEPFHKLNRRNTKWTWNTEHEAAFRKAKSVICSSPCLTLYRTEAEHKLAVDGSPSASGAVLLQKEGENWLPVYYCSKVFSEVEQRYAQIEREALAIYNGLTKCHNYVYGKRITVVTDHKALLRVFNKQATSIRLQGIVYRCADYDFELIFHPGPVNIADALSRLHKSASSNDSEIEFEIKVSLVQLCGANAFTTVRTATLADKDLQILTEAIRDEWKKPIYKRNLTAWCRFRDELTKLEDVIIKNGALIIPGSLRQDILAKAHSTHQGIVRTKQYLRNAVYWPGMSSEIEEMCKEYRICRQLLLQEKLPMSPVEQPKGPWIQIGIDIYSFEFDHYLTIQD